jgi:hypothetical protein
MYDGTDKRSHKQYGHPTLDESKIFKWFGFDNPHFPDFYLYSNSTGTVGIWMHDGSPIIEGSAKCLGSIYTRLAPIERILFMEEYDAMAALFGVS